MDLYDIDLIKMEDGTVRTRRSVYPAEMIDLPRRDDAKQDPYAWRTNIIRRLWVDSLDGMADSLADLRGNQDSHWFWLGAHQSDGRAVIRLRGKVKSIPRVLWTLLRGGSPDTRRVVKRTCDHAECVNPFHHELMKRGSWQTKGTEPQVNR
ncbi:hypothetical protein ACIBEF_29205 [Micromonospora sp. NPDC050795]|uniref:hypothetical protein n=1 Tax=Micromonospora sp. NPDC050795 TaxID=3364282 RepID=UPI003797E7CE